MHAACTPLRITFTLSLATFPEVAALNQITSNIPVALIGNNHDVEHTLDCSPTQNTFEELAQDIERMRDQAKILAHQNDELKQTIDSIYTSPAEKRELLTQLEQKHGISRRRACRLLTFARSTCWYRSTSGNTTVAETKTAITTLSKPALIQRLKKLARQAENGFLPLDQNLQSQFEYGLNRIGLSGAALLSRSNLKLAIEIFSVWCRQENA
jgi:hypothetical protein